MIITSNTNEQIKNLIHLKDKSKARKTSGTFIVEGIKMFQEIPKEDFIKAYASENFYEKRKEEIANDEFALYAHMRKIGKEVKEHGFR